LHALHSNRSGARYRVGGGWANRFPGVVAAALALKATRFLIDGEVMVAGPDGRAVFDQIARHRVAGLGYFQRVGSCGAGTRSSRRRSCARSTCS
jgi:hypothetical protein